MRDLPPNTAASLVAARSGEALRALAASLPVECLVHPCDLREPDAAEALIAAAMAGFGRIDLLVNNAGATRRGDFLVLDDEDWQDGFALKFFGAMRCCRAAWPHLQASRGGIVIVSGIGGRTGSAEFTIGGAVNAALLNLTKALADRGTRDGIRVNAINPASIATERLTARVRAAAEVQGIAEVSAAERLAQAMGVARFGRPEEIAAVVAFLASPRSAYCHGAIIDVDGGQTHTL
jgi:3-oxoacyl-[acyl-carrier protein] reductase